MIKYELSSELESQLQQYVARTGQNKVVVVAFALEQFLQKSPEIVGKAKQAQKVRSTPLLSADKMVSAYPQIACLW